MAKADINKRIDEEADVLQITDKLNNKATELFGGKIQHASKGRALVRSSSIFVMVEPLSSLDAKLYFEFNSNLTICKLTRVLLYTLWSCWLSRIAD